MTTPATGRVVVFVGPTLRPELRPPDVIFEWRAPAVAGDAYALEESLPAAVVLIDGLFDEWPAIRHKELLTLIARGIPVIGGASMGALRAAELHSLGMIGVGHIFAAYSKGRLDRDDEVAVLHGPAEFDWTALTEALVNVRATLVHAVRRRVIESEEGRRVRGIAAAMFYKERTWPSVLETAERDDPSMSGRLRRLGDWLPKGRVDLKALDARACLEAALQVAKAPGSAGPAPPDTSFARLLAEQVSSGIRPDPGCDRPR